MGIDFELEPLDCEPFYHGYGEKCSDAELRIGVRRLPLDDLNGNKIDIPFYITKGSVISLLGNELLSKSDILNTQNRMRTPPGTVKGLASEVHLPIYQLVPPKTEQVPSCINKAIICQIVSKNNKIKDFGANIEC